jgi:tRNA uridine 5-carboxymethylaminomethyl modification enzyme
VIRKKDNIGAEIKRLKDSRLDKILRRPGVNYADIVFHPGVSTPGCPPRGGKAVLMQDEITEVETEIKYEGFITRQLGDIQRFDKLERIKIPEDIDYRAINGLSNEIMEKLTGARPVNLGQASRISGVTPAAVSILMVWLEKTRRQRS